jgi:NADH-quinone oxidoreductase subunit N
MITVLEVLLPTVIFAAAGVVTALLTPLIERTPRKERFLAGLVVAPFLASSVAVFNLSKSYYNQQSPFLNVSLGGQAQIASSSSFLVDAVSIYMVVVYLFLGLISCVYGALYLSKHRLSSMYCALALMVVGFLIAGTFSGDLLTLFIFWEISTTASYALIAFEKKPESLEACLKFLIMIVLGSGFIVYGLSIVYGLTGSLNFWVVREALIAQADKRLLIAAFTFIASGYAIEAAIVPFHMWLPDVYTASPASTSALMSAVMDQASYYVLIRVLVYILTPPAVVNWVETLAVFSAITMTVGNLFALVQENVKRMISYVCIADIGYNLIAITSVTPLGVEGNLFFFLTGGSMTALSFMCVGLLNRMGLETLDDLSGMGSRSLGTALPLTIVALSFSGMPPLAGFIAKYMIFTAAIEANMWWLAIIGVVNSVIETGYILRLIHVMFFRPIKKEADSLQPVLLLIPIYVLVVELIVLGVYPSLALTLISPAARQIPIP